MVLFLISNLQTASRTMITRLIVIHFTLATFFLTPLQAQPPKLVALQKEYAEAVKSYTNGTPDLAITQLIKLQDAAYENKYTDLEASVANLLAEHYAKNGNYTIARKYNTRLLQLITGINNSSLLLEAKSREGQLLLEEGKLQEAEMRLNEAVTISNATAQKNGEINSSLGSVYLAKGNKEKALEKFLEAAAEFEADNKEKLMAETYSNISSVYYLSGDVDGAIKMAEQSIGLRKKINDANGLIMSSINIGQLYLLKNNSSSALQHLKEAVSVSEKTSNTKLKASAAAALSVYYVRNKMYEEAYPLQTKAVLLFEELNDKTQLSRMYVAIGGLANIVKDSATAVGYFQKGLQVSKEIQNNENIANALDKLSSFYLLRSNYKKAYDYYKDYSTTRDSILSKSNFAKINEYKIKYETEKKDNEINRLNDLQKLKQLEIEKQTALLKGNKAEAEKKQAEITLLLQTKLLQSAQLEVQENAILQKDLAFKNEQQKYTLTNNELKIVQQEAALKAKDANLQKLWRNGIAAALILSLLFFVILFNRFKLKKELARQQEMLTIRNNISKDLHDEIGSTLTSIQILSSTSANTLNQDSTKAKEMMQEIAAQSKTIQQNMSDIVWSIRPDNEKIENLLVRMREYAAQTLEQLGMKVSIQADEKVINQSLPMECRKDLLLIYKEAINNIAKHAASTEVYIVLQKMQRSITLSIQDNGKWKGDSSGTGTKSMQQRAVLHGGTFVIDGTDKGTCILLTLPIT